MSVFINDKNENNDFRDFNNSFENEKIDFNNNFSYITVSLFVGIGNNINIYNKLMNLKMNKRCKNKNDNFRYYNSDKNIKGF